MPELILTMRDVRAARMCSSGARLFFKQHGLDWQKFLDEGISESELASTNDALAKKLIESAHKLRPPDNGQQ